MHHQHERNMIPAKHSPSLCPSVLLHVPVSEHTMITVLLVVFLGLLLSASCVLVFRSMSIHRLGHSGITRMAKVMY